MFLQTYISTSIIFIHITRVRTATLPIRKFICICSTSIMQIDSVGKTNSLFFPLTNYAFALTQTQLLSKQATLKVKQSSFLFFSSLKSRVSSSYSINKKKRMGKWMSWRRTSSSFFKERKRARQNKATNQTKKVHINRYAYNMHVLLHITSTQTKK